MTTHQRHPRQGRIHLNPELAAKRARSPEMIPELPRVLEMLAKYRILLPWQLAKLLYLDRSSNEDGTVRSVAAAQTTARRALLQLRINNLVSPKELGYYNRKRQSVKTTGFVLTQAGANLLEDLLDAAGAEPHHRWHRDIIRWQPFSATHLMRVNDALQMLEAAAELADYDVVGWEDEAGIKSLKASGAWTSAIQPDGYLMIDTGRSEHTILIEVDNDTEWLTGVASNTWTNKMHRYAEFFKNFDADPFWHDSARPVVLTFAPTLVRAQKLIKATTRAGNLRHYWFATFDPLYPESPAPPKRDPALPKFAPNPVWLSPAGLFDHQFLVHGVDGGRTLADKFRL